LPAAEAAAQLLPPQANDDEQRLHEDPSRHLALPDPPVMEHDRDFADPRSRAAGPERRLDLEHVAARMDAIERDRGERFGAPRLEAAGQVVRLEPQECPREDAPAA